MSSGWLYWYFWVLVVPVEAIAGAKILQTFLRSWLLLSQLQIGLGLMAIMTAVNLMSARSYAEFEFWFASIKVAAILVFVVIAASFAFGWTAPQGATFANLVNYGGFTPRGWIAVLGRGAHGVLRHDRRGDHDRRRGGIGAAGPRHRQNDHHGDLAHLDFLCRVRFS